MSARTEGVTQFQAVGYRTQTQTQNRLWHTCKIIIWACLNSRVLMLNLMLNLMFPIKGAISWGKFPMNHLKLRPQAAKELSSSWTVQERTYLPFPGRKKQQDTTLQKSSNKKICMKQVKLISFTSHTSYTSYTSCTLYMTYMPYASYASYTSYTSYMSHTS